MKASNANKVVSVLLSVAMCPMMVPSAAFAVDDDAASDASSPIEQAQSADQAEASGTSASSSDAIAPQSEATGETTAPAAEASGEEGAEAAVAQVGEATYTTLEAAFAALNSSNRTLTLLDESAWDAATPVYYKAGEVSGYVAKLTDALTAAYKANAGDIAIVCRPGSDLGAMTHGHVADNIAIYGNGAYISGGECDLEVDTYQYSRETGKQTTNAVTELAGKTITINAYDVANLGVWGQRNTDATVNVNLTNCDGKALGATNVQRVYISGMSGVNNFTLTDCDFITTNTAVYSNADGAVSINNCSFAGSIVPVNFNHKAAGTQTVTVANSTFANCGTTGEWAAFAAPARFVNSGTGALNATINACSFADTVGVNGDILIGDGRTGQKSNEVTLTVTKTAANVQAQKPGYYGEGTTVADASLKGEVATTAAEGLDGASIESIVTPAPAAVAEVAGKNYPSLQAAIDAAAQKATVKLLADTKENVTISTRYVTLDLNGHTLNGSTGERKPALTVTNYVYVKDSSAAQTGTIMREDTAENSGVSSHYVIDVQGGNSGWLFFQSGNVKNDSGAGGTKGASLVRVGDDSKPGVPGLTISGGTFTQDNFIALKCDHGNLYVKGGTINSANSYAVQNWKNATIKDSAVINGNVSTWTYGGGGSDLQIQGGVVNGDIESVTYDGAEGKAAKVAITGGTVNGSLYTIDYSTGATTNDPTKATIEVTGGTFSADPSRYLVESSTATQNADGTYGVAKAYLAQVGETSYYTMDEAFKAQTASGEAITLLRDYTTGSTFNSGTVARVVDLNGHTWTCTGTDANSAAFEINNPNASLTVKNGKIVSSQLIGLIPSAMGGTITYDNSTLTFEGVEASTTATSGIETNGNNTNDAVVLKDSMLNVPNGFGIYFPSSGTLTIDNSTINAKTMGAQVCSGNLNVTAGSAITVSGDPVEKLEGDGAIQDGAAISIVNRLGYKGLGQIAITGGTFKAKGNNAAIKAYTWDSATKLESAFDNSAKTVAVSGGTFSSAVASDLCAEGYAPVANADGTYSVAVPVAQIGGTVFTSLQAAIDAAQDGDTVQLLGDVEQNSQLAIGKNITLDLNGRTIRNTVDIWSKNANAILSIKNGAKVTITGNGTIDAKENDCYTINVAKGDLTIENGTFYGNVSVVQVQEGTLSVKGGTFDLHQKWEGSSKYLINCIDDAYVDGSANVAISGGTFVGFDPNVSPEQKVDGKAPSFAAPGTGITKNEDGSFTAAASMTAQILDKDGNSVKAYASLQAAIDAAQDGETVTLLADATEDVAISKSITLDLDGKTLTNANAGKATISVQGGTVTVKNGSVVGGTGNYNIEVTKDSNANLTLADVTATAGNTGSSMIDNWGTLTIESGEYSGGMNAVKSEEGSTLTINGGTFTCDFGKKWSYTAVVLVYGDTTINGGEFIQKTTNTSSYAKVVMTGKVEGYEAFTKVTGGKFVNEKLSGIFWALGKATSDNFEVSGGTFNKKVTDSYCADGLSCVKNADGTYGVAVAIAQIGSVNYASLQDAINAAKSRNTVKLLTDTTENVTIDAAKQITLGLNGHTLNGGTGTAKAAILNKGTVTITDTSAGKTGTIKRDDQGVASETSYYVIDNNGTMVIDRANVINNSGSMGSSLIRNGGVDNVSSLTINGGTFEQQNFIAVKNDSNGELTINGGTLTSKQSVVQNWNKAQILGGNLTGIIWTDSWTEAGTVGETVIGGDAHFTGRIYMDVTGPNPSTLKIEGGSLDVTKWTVTSAAAEANSTIAVSGGTFTAAVPENYCAAGYVPVTNADGTYGVAVGKFTVQVTSRTTTSDSPVANVSGGGSDITYAEGTTVTASAISGYKFVGWFVNEYAGTPYSTDLTCTVKPTDNCTMIAVYEPVSGGKFWLTVTASEFTVNGGAVQDSYLYEQYAIGASVTVNFTGSENFLYWVNASNKVVSTNKSYTFTMGSETTLKAVYGKARQNQATVVFISHSDQIISSKAYTASDTIQFPVPPIKMGCTFTGWSMTESEIREAMANNSGIIQVRALYTEPSVDCAVTVVYPDGTDDEVVNAKVGQLVNVTAKDIEGKTFSYWTDNDGNVLGYTKTLKLAPSGDMTVNAIYSDGATEAKPVISMTAVDANAGNGYYLISFTATRAVPEGYELVKQGVLYSIDSRCAGDAGKDYLKLTADGTVPEGVYEYSGGNNDPNGVTRFNGKVRTADTTLYGRGYMILKNRAGEVLYVYSDTILSGSYNSLKK